MTSTIGDFLQQTSYTIVPHREKIKFTHDQHYYSLLKDLNLETLCVTQLLKSNGLFGCRYPVLERAVTLHCEGKFAYATALVLPQLEHAMRRLFSTVNNCPHRVMTAEATVLYTTFDEILDQHMPSGEENKIKSVLGENFLDMIHDLLVYPDGPRVRDKLGHGEVNWCAFPESLSKAVLVTMCALTVQQYGKVSNETSDVHNSFLKSICELTEQYESLYHPISLVKSKVMRVSMLVSSFSSRIQLNPDLGTRVAASPYTMDGHHNQAFQETTRHMLQLCDIILAVWTPDVQTDIKLELFTIMSESDLLAKQVLKKRISTLYAYQKETLTQATNCPSPNRESQIVVFLQHILQEVETALNQVFQTLVSRQQQMVAKQLRSRQRDNLQRLLNSCPFFHQAGQFIVFVSTWLLYTLRTKSKNTYVLIKWLKTGLQFVENLRTYTSSEKNKWTEAVELWSAFIKQSTLILPKVILTS